MYRLSQLTFCCKTVVIFKAIVSAWDRRGVFILMSTTGSVESNPVCGSWRWNEQKLPLNTRYPLFSYILLSWMTINLIYQWQHAAPQPFIYDSAEIKSYHLRGVAAAKSLSFNVATPPMEFWKSDQQMRRDAGGRLLLGGVDPSGQQNKKWK